MSLPCLPIGHFVKKWTVSVKFSLVQLRRFVCTFSDSERYHRWNNKHWISQHAGLVLFWLYNRNGNGYGQCIYSSGGTVSISQDEVTTKLPTGTWILLAHEFQQLRNSVTVLYRLQHFGDSIDTSNVFQHTDNLVEFFISSGHLSPPLFCYLSLS